MTAGHDAVSREVRKWVRYAEEDRRLAEQASQMTDPPHRLVAFHAQQCAEKYLKAFLLLKDVEFPYTHNISTLLELCWPHGDWARTLMDAGYLNDYAVSARYPGSADEVTPEEASTAMALAGRVREAVLTALAQEGMTF